MSEFIALSEGSGWASEGASFERPMRVVREHRLVRVVSEQMLKAGECCDALSHLALSTRFTGHPISAELTGTSIHF